jgi:2-dehydropantoate 2-reductase
VRIAVFGTGGVGAYFGARLAEAGNDVAFVARGAHLEAIRAHGLRVDSVLGDMLVKPVVASDRATDIGPVDAVLLGVKTWQVEQVAPDLNPLLAPDTFVVPLQNGVETADIVAAAIGRGHTVGGVCGGFCFLAGPGHVRHIGGITFIKFGELDGRKTARVERLREQFAAARVDVGVPDDIRVALWEKLLLVVPFGGVGAVTRAPIGVLMKTAEARALMETGMREIAAVARALGVELPPRTIERTLEALDGTTPTGTSSLQRDVAAGKPSELEAWTGAVVRLGRKARVPTPLHSFLYAALLPQERRARGSVEFP